MRIRNAGRLGAGVAAALATMALATPAHAAQWAGAQGQSVEAPGLVKKAEEEASEVEAPGLVKKAEKEAPDEEAPDKKAPDEEAPDEEAPDEAAEEERGFEVGGWADPVEESVPVEATATGSSATAGGLYDSTSDGSPSQNGSENGNHTGTPCAGCVGNADDKNPPGQLPGPEDENNGYECDGNEGVGQGKPAHSGCTSTLPPCVVDCDPPGTGGEE